MCGLSHIERLERHLRNKNQRNDVKSSAVAVAIAWPKSKSKLSPSIIKTSQKFLYVCVCVSELLQLLSCSFGLSRFTQLVLAQFFFQFEFEICFKLLTKVKLSLLLPTISGASSRSRSSCSSQLRRIFAGAQKYATKIVIQLENPRMSGHNAEC